MVHGKALTDFCDFCDSQKAEQIGDNCIVIEDCCKLSLLATPEAVNRRTDNTLPKRKRTKGQTTIYKTLHSSLKIEQHEPH